ncbi:MAG: hypothetical protein LUI85_19220, partial [Bacteroides sp.]|nr:hypothetical protein [Bacteroides sp.]
YKVVFHMLQTKNVSRASIYYISSDMQQGTSPLNPPFQGGNLRVDTLTEWVWKSYFECKDED